MKQPVSKWEEQIQVIHTLYDSSPDNTVNFDGQALQARRRMSCRHHQLESHVHQLTWQLAVNEHLMMTGKYGDGWLPIGYTPELFEDHAAQIKKSMDENGRSDD